MHQHQHGPQCNHGHGHGQAGHGHGAMRGMMGFGGQQPEQSPEEYFGNLKKKWSEKENRVFFWQQVLHGVVLDRLYEKWGLEFMRSVTCQLPQMIINSVQMMISFDWVPLRIKPITNGLFFPLMFLLFFNYNVVVGVTATDDYLKVLAYTTMTLYLLVALRGCSSLKSDKVVQKCKQIYEIRPYLDNPNMSCQACKITRMFRATHCPFCKVCVAKHSRHSLVFGSCIGAANELLCALFFLSLTLTLGFIVYHFFATSSYGLLTKIMFYSLNVTLCWMSFTQFLQFFVFNYIYGVTEQQLKIWFMLQYLQKIPERTFSNNVNQGFCLNLTGSLMALLGISGFESDPSWSNPQLSFPAVDSSRSYLTNWDKALLYLVPQLPFHKNRAQIIQMMQRDEPRMIEMFKLQKQFRAEIMAEAGAEHLNEFQLQQRMAMKMQAHMARNMPQMMPSPDQQRNIQLQMMAHMKRQFANQTDLFQKFNELETKLKGGEMNPIEANMTMRMLQQQLMARRMQKLQQQVKEQQPQQKSKTEDEEAPMREMPDQDL